MRTSHRDTERRLRVELERVQAKLAELEATTAAIRSGDVDAIVVDGPKGSQVFTLQSGDDPYRTLAERMNEGAATLSADGTILFCNRRLAEMAGLPSERLLGSSFAALLRANQRNGLQDLLQSAVEKDIRSETELLRNDGTSLPVQLSISLVSLGESENAFCLVASDLSELNRARRGLREQSEIFDLAHDAILIRDLHSRIQFWNRGAGDLYGWPAKEALGKDSFELLQTVLPEPLEAIMASLSERRDWRGELTHIRSDGRKIVVASRWSLLRDESGNATAILEINRDVTARIEAQEKLRIASRYTRSLIEASLDPLVTISREGKITDVNVATEIVTGIARERLIGTDFSNYFTEPEKAREGYQQAFAEGTVRDYPLAIRSMSGKVTEVLYNASVFRNEAGEVEGVFAAARDVTERNRGEAKLRSASLYTRSLIEASPDPLVTISREGKITDVNEATEKVTGVTRKQLIATDFSDYFTEPEDARRGYLRVFAEGSVHNYPLAIRSTSGVVTDVLYNASVFRNEAGEVEGVFAAARDVTERNRIEAARIQANEELRKLNQELESRVDARTQELKDSEQRVRRKLESILSAKGDLERFELSDIMDLGAVQSLADGLYKLTGLPFFLLDLEGNVLVEVGWQSACRDFHRVHPEACRNCRESDGQLSTGVLAGEFKLYKCKNQMWDVVTPIVLGDRHIGNLFSGQFFFDDEETDFALFRRQARKFDFDEKDYLAALHRVPRLDREQVMTGMAFYAKLTNLLTNLGYSGIKLGQAMAETKNVNAQLADSVKELESFAYSVSHDLRAPLRHIDGFLTLLSTRTYSTLDDASKHYVDRTLLASKRMGELIDDLLRFSRIGRSEIRKVPVDLNVVIQEILRELEPEIGKRKIDWQLTPLPNVMADRAMLLQVVENLIANALKFTRGRETAKIEVGFKPEANGQLVFFVRDNGAGFDMRYYGKLFQVFQRLHGEQEFEGTGIGLAIARSVVERHGGRIWAEGSLGHGATFYFSLPAEGREGEMNELAEAHLAG